MLIKVLSIEEKVFAHLFAFFNEYYSKLSKSSCRRSHNKLQNTPDNTQFCFQIARINADFLANDRI